jgi:Holliday junction resolvase
MSARERDKGARGERELVELLHAAGWPRATRNFASGGRGNGDVAGGPQGVVFECKRHRGRLDLPAAMRQAEQAAGELNVPVVAHRRDGHDWWATLPLSDLLDLLALRERG